MLNDSVSCFKLVPENTAISLTGEYLSNFTLPTANEKVKIYDSVMLLIVCPELLLQNMEWELTPNDCFSVGELRNGKMISSFHQKWLGIGSIDGRIRILTVKKPVSM